MCLGSKNDRILIPRYLFGFLHAKASPKSIHGGFSTRLFSLSIHAEYAVVYMPVAFKGKIHELKI